METGRRLAAPIDDFVEQIGTLWQDYQRLGPGQLAASRMESVVSAATEIRNTLSDPDLARWLEQMDCGRELRDELQAQVKQLTRLARACACTPQGLSFVTGEAGLIPRKDQHEALASGLVKLGEMAAELRESF